MKKTIYIHLFLFLSITVYSQNKIILSTVQTVGRNVIAGEEISLAPGFSFTSDASKSMSLQVDISTYQISQSAVADPNANKALAASTNQNYILTRTYMQDDAKRFLDQIQYFDGLGRPSETVQRGITKSGNDLISFQEYDGFGRESNAWLPVAISANNGAYADLIKVKSHISASYPSEANPHSKPVYESSPLNRILEQYGPGSDWHSKGKRVRTEYLTNTASGVQASICFSVTGALLTTALKKNANYGAGQLYVTKMTGEDESVSYEFKDKLGQVVLTRQMLGTTQHDTYYVYDDLGNLSYVLPPKAVDEVTNFADNDPKMRHLAFLYKYDTRNRCTKKRLPSTAENNTDVNSGWIFYVYDKADQLIFSQDGEQRKKGEWFFSITDAFGRMTLAGISKNVLAVGNQIGTVVRATLPDAANGPYKGYNIAGLTLTTPIIYSANYYDNYNFKKLAEISSKGLNFDATKGTEYNKRYGTDLTVVEAKGQITGSIVALFDGGTTSYLHSALYYDNRGRLIQSQSSNHLGGKESELIAYNFTGQPIKKMHVHTATGKTTQTEHYAYDYDHAGRLLKTRHKTDALPETILAENSYDELGRLKTNKKGNNANLNTTYEYNVRSWITKMSSPLFTQNLFYNVSPAGFANKAQYGGNISAMSWTVKGDAERKYGFTYDNLSRLKQADYGYATSGGNFSTSYAYDKHGNMLNHAQRGLKTVNSYDVVDNLAMSYNGNQLINVHNVGTGSNASETHAHFQDYSKDAAKTKVEYTYNANGAMTQDLNKGISTIQYNSLNLPRLMDIKSPVAEARNEYTYSASGQKLRVVSKWNSTYSKVPLIGSGINISSLNVSKTTDYAGNKIYENGVLKRILIDGGYIEGSKYHYYQTDHLGNNRVVADNNGAIVQSTHYYPFGMAFAEGTGGSKQPYKYNGKELDTQHGLNTYDYSARYMDPGIGRFTTVDPLAEKYYSISPYVYCNNNPIRFIDPTGKEGIKYTDKDGNKIVESNVVVLVEQKKTIPQNATAKQIAKIDKQNAKIDKRNSERVADVQNRLNETYNGSDGKGTKNSAGETVKFKFNVTGQETSNTDGGTMKQIRAIAAGNSLSTGQKDVTGKNISAFAAVVTTRSTRGSQGLSNGIYVTESIGAPKVTLPHEIGHTLNLNDNYPSSTGGLMDYPPGGLISSEVDEIWRSAYAK